MGLFFSPFLFRANEALESEIYDLRTGYMSLLQKGFMYKLDGSTDRERVADFIINDKVFIALLNKYFINEIIALFY